MENIKVEIINSSPFPLPHYATLGSSGADLYANIENPLTINPGEIVLVPTGVRILLPKGIEAQIRARSGLSAKHGVILVNGIGTIDSDYTGEIKIIMSVIKKEPYIINPGDRIAQMVLCRYFVAEFDEVTSLEETLRGEGGFGSSGK